MKILSMFLTLCVLPAWGCAARHAPGAASTPVASQPAPAPASSPAPATADDQALSAPGATLIVHGLSCPLCAHNIDKQLLRIRGVQSVDVDLGSGRVRLEFAGRGPSPQQLRQAVDNAGFSLQKIETP